MTIDEIFEEFSRADCVLPQEAMQWSLDHWDEVLPSFIEALNDPAIGPQHPNDPRFFIVHLLGEKKELQAHIEICRMLLSDPVELEYILGGTKTEGLNGILINTFDGDPKSLTTVIETEWADEYIRSQAFDALTYLYAEGTLAAFDMRSYVTRLGEDLEPKETSYVWTAWAEAVARLGYDELEETCRLRRDQDLIEDTRLLPDEFADLLAMSKEHGPMAVFAHDRVNPYGKAIDTLSEWDEFSPEAQERARDQMNEEDEDNEYWEEQWKSIGDLLPQVSAVNPLRDVGRNDPCPCGSGKKFKKCCLGSAK